MRPSRAALTLAAIFTLGACADFSGIGPQGAALAPATLGLQAPAPLALSASDFDSQWWRSFGDKGLDALVTQALQGSPSLQVAAARVARAQALTEVLGAADGLQSSAAVDLSRQRFSSQGMYPPPLAGGVYETANLQLNLGYEWDFFGKNRAALDAAIGQNQAAIAELQQARLLLSTQVTRSYFALLRLQAQKALQQSFLAQREQAQAIGRARRDAGLDSQLEFLSGPITLPEIRQQIEALQEQIAVTRNSLAALCAVAPSALVMPEARIEAVRKAPVQESLPLDLLGRRPDIVAARWRIEATTSDMAQTKAQFYPNISIGGFVGLNSVGWSNITRSGSEQWGAGPALRLPVFDSGRLRAQLRGKAADLDGAIAAYNGLVFEAVREVNEQLISLRSIAQQQREQQTAQVNAQSLLQIAQQRHEAGLLAQSAVINAQNALVAHQRQAIDLQARALDVQAQLLRALGGGYSAPTSVAQATP